MNMFEHYPLLTVGGTLLLAALIVTMLGVTWWFDLRHARLPEATRHEDLHQRNALLQGQLGEKRAELADIQRRIQDRDRVAAEVASLTEQLGAIRLEMAAMAETERQIDELKRRTAEAALQHAETEQRLTATLAEQEAAEAAIKAAQEKLAALPQHRDDLLQAVEQLLADRQRLEDEVASLRGERGLLLAAREEAVAITARQALLTEEVARLTAERQQQSEICASLQMELVRMQEQKAALQADLAGLQPLRTELQELGMQRPLLTEAIGRLAEDREKLTESLEQLRGRLAEAWDERNGLQAELTDLRQRREEVEGLTARKAALALEIEKLEGAGNAGAAAQADDEDLRRLPSCLTVLGAGPRPHQEESAAIEAVRQSLGRHGLKYHPRTVDAFHTALKINEAAQLTVLAGVSGTGKSLLPRRYAEAMGIGFLPIAVEPRWDSPQDLLGFYNYVEKRYRGTELARALVHMDPQNTSGLSDGSKGDRMLLVLLDEMNLARVEYYFSEFLSRLEMRPRWGKELDATARRQASMPLDTRGRAGGTVHLFPAHNVLFVGTMNDDESTQALSDKVLDRGNVMQFPAPATFERPQDQPLVETSGSAYLDHASWRGWIRRSLVADAAEASKIQQVINRLAAIMQRCGRPFGHRLNEAMMAYVANYPRSAVGKLRFEEALADQVELRILPKLRGVVIDDGDTRGALEEMVKLIGEDLHDSGFAQHLGDLLAKDQSQFNWRGMDRSQA